MKTFSLYRQRRLEGWTSRYQLCRPPTLILRLFFISDTHFMALLLTLVVVDPLIKCDVSPRPHSSSSSSMIMRWPIRTILSTNRMEPQPPTTTISTIANASTSSSSTSSSTTTSPTDGKRHNFLIPEPRAGDVVRRVQERTKLKVVIAVELNDSNLAKCHPQHASPLFRLPKEIRDLIFRFACAPTIDTTRLYNDTEYYFRPGYEGPHKTYATLLLTCRRAWLEGNALPLNLADLTFWFQHGPFDRHSDAEWAANVSNEKMRYNRFLNSLTDLSLSRMTNVTFYLQMFQAELLRHPSKLSTIFPLEMMKRGYSPRFLRLGLRHSDFWWWEKGEPVALDSRWVQAVLDSSLLGGLRELWLELEVEESRVDQLRPIILELQQLSGAPKIRDVTRPEIQEANQFIPKEGPPSWTWTRSAFLADKEWPVYKDQTTIDLHVTTLKWVNVRCKTAEHLNAFTASPESSPTRGPSNLIRPRPRLGHPLMLARSRAQRDRLRSGGWIHNMFPDKADVTWLKSVENARKTEAVERERFEQMVGVIEARRVQKEWEERKSLLRLDPTPV